MRKPGQKYAFAWNTTLSFPGDEAPDDVDRLDQAGFVASLDPVASPRNSNWFLVLVAARRALSVLERQPEVDPARIGVTGHSMGGKLTTNLAGIDPRVAKIVAIAASFTLTWLARSKIVFRAGKTA